MVNQFEERHIHFCRSSKGILIPEKVLREIGLRKGSTILDAGCGEGHFSIAVSEMVGDEGRVYAIDIYEESIANLKKEIEKKRINNIEAMIADLSKSVPLEDENIDVCLMVDVFHGFVVNKEVESVMKEMARVLKVAGILVVIDFGKINGSPGPPISIRMSPEEIEEIVTPYGLKKVGGIEGDPYHFGVIFSKKEVQR